MKKRIVVSENKQKMYRVLIYIILVALFAGNYIWNPLQIVEPSWSTGNGGESLVYGRLAVSRVDGVFSHGGFLGVVGTKKIKPLWENQKTFFFAGIEAKHYFQPYLSQPGGQGVLFSLLQSISPLSPENNSIVFRGLTVLLAVFACMLWVGTAEKEWGALSASLVYVALFFSDWMLHFSGRIYWQIWCFVLPPLLLFLAYRKHNQFSSIKGMVILVGLSLLLKLLLTGFEFITCAIVALIVPIVYVGIANNWCKASWKRALAGISCGVATAVSVVLIQLMMQISLYRDQIWAGPMHIAYTIMKRTSSYLHFEIDGLKQVDHIYHANEDILNIFTRSFSKPVYFASWQDSNSFWSQFEVSAAAYVLAALCAALVLLLFARRTNDEKEKKRDIAIVAAVVISIFGPVSWMVIFKAHMSTHQHMNHIMWAIATIPWVPIAFGNVFIRLRCQVVSRR